ncbi:MAG: YtxH domain-containing protein [Chitinophagaceae bacterium]|nr:MAG: YtxH domain-containing protein [Chitinophagaceae bacterium]
MSKLLIGFSVGLITGLLFAPAKGSETRESIARKGRDIKDKFNDLVDTFSDKIDQLQTESEVYAERAGEHIRAEI